MEEKIKIGVLCPANIAEKRFMPALRKCENFEYIGIAYAGEDEYEHLPANIESNRIDASIKKVRRIQSLFGGTIFSGYKELLTSNAIDAVYIPLPPALHYKWAKYALENGKHVFMEKPLTTSLEDTRSLISIAKEKNLAITENYMFQFHPQLSIIKKIISDGLIGNIRLFRISFGFPFRGENDFRYKKALGGGSLLDCGGYTVKLASILLGSSTYIADSILLEDDRFDVDLYGNAVLRNDNHDTAQISFGMDNQYSCELQVWGSLGRITSDRVFTAPPDYEPSIHVVIGGNEQVIAAPKADHFFHSLQDFYKCIFDEDLRELRYKELDIQSKLVSEIQKNGGKS